MSDHQSLADKLAYSYRELLNKLLESKAFDDPEIMSRVDPILSDIRHINQRVNDLIVELDQNRINITPEEQARIEEYFIQDRILDRVKPFLVLSQIIETMDKEKNQIEASF